MMKKKNGMWKLYDGSKKVTEGSLAHVMREDYARKTAPKKPKKTGY
ncbi:hypothetical protein KAR91_49315 [Candidatus Pacearchaeota archaeon]|nr:hypothetical protein [Candidatus Pacearchaeota archaeon]